MKLEHNAKIQSLLSLSMTKKQMVMTSSAGREKKKKNNDTRHLIAKSLMTAEILGRKTNEEAATVMRFKKKRNKTCLCLPATLQN